MATLLQLRERIGRVVDSLRAVPALGARCRQLTDWLAEATDDATLRIGVVGVTSSGKTTLINALLGERLLPEDAQATTNTLVQCRRGPQRNVLVRRNGAPKELRLTGAEVTANALARLTSERHNPGNAEGIAAVDVSLPDALLPEDLVVIDTPGLDAHGMEDLETLVLQRLLPMVDIIVFVASIRRPFRPSELELLEQCVRENQRVLFLLSQADLERDSYEGGKLIHRREDRLQTHTEQLAHSLEAFPRLRSYGMATISAKQAQEGRHRSATWRESGFEQVLGYLRAFREDLAGVLAASRARHVAPLLQSCEEELQHHATIGGTAEQALHLLAKRETRAEELNDATQEADVSIGFECESWKGQLDPESWESQLRDAIEGFSDRRVDDFQNAVDAQRRQWHDLRQSLVAALMEAEAELARTLGRFELAPDHRGERHRRPEEAPFPSLDPFIWTSTEVYDIDHPRSWYEGGVFADWLRGRKQERSERLVRHLNTPALLVEVREYLQRGAEEIRHHLQWWQAHATQAYTTVLRDAAEHEARAMNELRDTALQHEQERETARVALENVHEARSWLRNVIALPEGATAPPKVPLYPTIRQTNNPPAPSRLKLAATALRPLVSTAWEAGFARIWNETVQQVAGPCERPRVLLLGARRENHLGLAAALAHQLDQLPHWKTLPSNTWLWMGRAPETTLPGPAHKLKEGGDWDVVIAPADADTTCETWTGLLSTFDAIGIECDLPRISCGLKQLHAAPYLAAASALAQRVFLCSGDAGMFADRLNELVEQVLPLAETRSPFAAAPPWFLYEVESYDARATVFAKTWREAATLDQAWTQRGLPWAPPFTRQRMAAMAGDASAFEELRPANEPGMITAATD